MVQRNILQYTAAQTTTTHHAEQDNVMRRSATPQSVGQKVTTRSQQLCQIALRHGNQLGCFHHTNALGNGLQGSAEQFGTTPPQPSNKAITVQPVWRQPAKNPIEAAIVATSGSSCWVPCAWLFL